MRKKSKTRRKGAATVEFAVIAPVFILLVLGMIEVGRGINLRHVLLNAARAGCRVGIVEGATQQDITNRVGDNLSGTGISTYNLIVLPNPLTSAVEGNPITVILTASYSDVSWVPVPQFLGGVTITGSCSLPYEGP